MLLGGMEERTGGRRNCEMDGFPKGLQDTSTFGFVPLRLSRGGLSSLHEEPRRYHFKVPLPDYACS